MLRKIFPLLCCWFLTAGGLYAAGTENAARPVPPHYFQESGAGVDSLVNRIWFKITYSWSKSGEYFRLACSSVTDTLPSKKRDIKARVQIKKEEFGKKTSEIKNDLMQQGKETVRDSVNTASDEISREAAELQKELDDISNELREEAGKEIRNRTGQQK